MNWSTSDRRFRLPPNWDALRDGAKRAAKGMCQAATHARGCTGIGAECDHIIAGDDHSPANLQWLSTPCHRAKTIADNARLQAERDAMRKRPVEQHPGAI